MQYKWLVIWGSLFFFAATLTAISNLDGAEIKTDKRVFHPVIKKTGELMTVSALNPESAANGSH